MDIDFPLVLSIAVIISGCLWLFDCIVLKPSRKRKIDQLKLEGLSADDTVRLLKEPVIFEYAKSFFPVLLLVLVLRSFLAEPYQIPSESMVPTLTVGDFILVNKYSYGLRLPVLGTKFIDIGEPERGDIMVFVPPHDTRFFIKRVIGLPGDIIRYENKSVYINGVRASYDLVEEFTEIVDFGLEIPVQEYKETIANQIYSTYRYNFIEQPKEWVVPDGSYFMMGDNRGKSEDSRAWRTDLGPTPFVPEENIVGKAVAIWMHKEPGWNLPTFNRNQFLNSKP